MPALATALVLGTATASYAADTTITSGPADGAALLPGPVTYTFSAGEGGATYECSVDGAVFTACPAATSATYDLAPGGHVFRVRSVVLGVRDDTPAQRIWTIRNVPCELAGEAYAAAQGKYFEWQQKLVKARRQLHRAHQHGTAAQFQQAKNRVRKVKAKIKKYKTAMNAAIAQENAVC